MKQADCYITTPLGTMLAQASERGLTVLAFTETTPPHPAPSHPILQSIKQELSLYFEKKLQVFQTPLDPQGTPFQKAVWELLCTLPYGTTCSYAHIASALGRDSAYRAVAQANGSNKMAIIIPCHRVIYKDGSLGGYTSGLERKVWLLKHESKTA